MGYWEGPPTLVIHMQGKHLTSYTISPAQAFDFLREAIILRDRNKTNPLFSLNLMLEIIACLIIQYILKIGCLSGHDLWESMFKNH